MSARGNAVAAPLIQFTDTRLSNGMRVIVAPDHAVPLVAMNIWYAVGSKHEKPGKTGFAHLFEHFMFEGSRNVPRGQHPTLIMGIGGYTNASTSFDRTSYVDIMPSDRFDLALWLEADRMGGLLDVLNQESLDTQRNVVKNEKRQTFDSQPYGTSFENMLAAVFPEGHPYSHTPIGSMADLDAASLRDIQDFFRSYYAPNNAVISIVGDVDGDEAVEAVERYFGGIPANPSIPARHPIPPLPPHALGTHREVGDHVPLARVYTGFRCPPYGTSEYDAVELAMGVLGTGRGGRLSRRLVRDLQVAEDVEVEGLELAEGNAVASITVTVRPDHHWKDAEAALNDELARLRSEPLPPEELERARALLISADMASLARADDVADRLSRYATLFDQPGRINDVAARYNRVDEATIQAVASDVFAPDNGATLVYVPTG
jgi:predicted Zn-dependent peptidase